MRTETQALDAILSDIDALPTDLRDATDPHRPASDVSHALRRAPIYGCGCPACVAASATAGQDDGPERMSDILRSMPVVDEIKRRAAVRDFLATSDPFDPE